MAVLNPPFALQNAGPVHTAAGDRLMVSGLIASGSGSGLAARGGVSTGAGAELFVSQTGTPSMAVTVGSGIAYVPGSESGNQGVYACVAESTTTLNLATAHGSLSRIDSIIARVYDSQYSGIDNKWDLEVVTGTPASSPTPPPLPANSLRLANVTVGAAVTSVTNGNIQDTRPWLAAAGGTITVRNQTERDALTGFAQTSAQSVFRLDTGNLEFWHNGGWVVKSPTRPIRSAQTANPPFTTTGTFVDFTSGAWPPVVFTAPPSGQFEVTISAAISNSAAAPATIWAAYRLSGGLVASANEFNGLSISGTRLYASRTVSWDSATPGSTVTVTPQWYISNGNAATAVCTNGQLIVKLIY